MKKGIESLIEAVKEDQEDYWNNEKYQWILDRAKHYSEKTGMPVEDVIQAWEESRSYWYENFYQDANQPLLDSKKIVKYDDWITELKNRFGDDPKKWAFKCVSCGETQSVQDFIDNKVDDPESKVYFSCIGRYVEGRGCDWTLGGFFTIHKTSVLQGARVVPVFEMADKV